MAALGNHEFDVAEADFRARLTESHFPYVSANVATAAEGAPFPNVSRTRSSARRRRARRHDARRASSSVVMPSNPKAYVVYGPIPSRPSPSEAARLAPRPTSSWR